MTYIPYFKGDWTPIVTLTGAGTAPQYSTTIGTYSRIGRVVFYQIQLSGDGGNEGSGVGAITVTLPFTTGANQYASISHGGVSINGVQENNIFCLMSAGSTTMSLKYQSSASQLSDFTGADQNNTTRSIILSGKFIINY